MAPRSLTTGPRPLRVLYLTYNENVLESGILYSQVRAMLRELAGRPEVGYVRLLSFISPRLWLRRRRGYRRLKRELASGGIDFRRRLMPAAQGWCWLALPLIVACCLPVVLVHLICGRFDILHARSYGAGLLGYLGAGLAGVRMVFDPRGPYPEEMVLNRRWREGGLTFRLWKALEHRMVTGSAAVVGVTPQMRDRHREQGARKALFIPNRAAGQVGETSAERSAGDGGPLLVFTGEMDPRWYHPERIARHFARLKEAVPGLKLKLISRRGREFVSPFFERVGLVPEDWSLEPSRPEEIPGKIAGASLGLILGIPQPGGWDGWPVKLAEYLAAGVPVALEAAVGEHLVRMVKRWRLGAVIEENDPKSYRSALDVVQHRAEYAARCRRYARLKLHISHTAAQVARLYRQLIYE